MEQTNEIKVSTEYGIFRRQFFLKLVCLIHSFESCMLNKKLNLFKRNFVFYPVFFSFF